MRKYINQQDMKQANAADVFALVRSREGMTRKEIEETTELSWGAVSNITGRLLREAYLTEYKEDSTGTGTGAGRTPARLSVNGSEHFTVGLDINGAGFRGVVLNLRGEVMAHAEEPAPVGADKETVLAAIFAFARRVRALAADKHLFAVGVAMQGEVSEAEGISVACPFVPGWHNVPLAQLLSEELGVPVFLEHDPNCLLYAWMRESEAEDTMLVRAQGGIGMSVLIDGRIVSRTGMFEIGHLPAVKNGVPCGCGRRGCLECYASPHGIARQLGVPFADAEARAEAGDTAALAVFSDAVQYLNDAIVRAARFLNIGNVVLCGELWETGELVFDPLSESLRKEEHLRVSRIGTKNAAEGAALIAVERSLELL